MTCIEVYIQTGAGPRLVHAWTFPSRVDLDGDVAGRDTRRLLRRSVEDDDAAIRLPEIDDPLIHGHVSRGSSAQPDQRRLLSMYTEDREM